MNKIKFNWFMYNYFRKQGYSRKACWLASFVSKELQAQHTTRFISVTRHIAGMN